MNDERQHNGNERHELAVELLSAYLDDPADLSDEDRRQVEARLESDPETRRALAELRLIASELRELPAMSAPRSYHLDPGMVGAPEPVVLQQTTAWYARHSVAVRWATAAAAVIFVFVLSADLVLNGVFSDESDSMDNAMPVSESRLSEQPESGSDDDDAGIMQDATGGGEAADEPYAATKAEAEAESGGDDAAAEDSSTLEGAPEPTAAEAEAEEAEGGAVEAPTEAESSPPAVTEGAREGEARSGAQDELTTMIAVDPAGAEEAGDDDGANRRPWRVAEFGLVVILGLLITAMVVLPRLSGTSARGRNG